MNATEGAMIVPIMVSVATGHVEYHPLYLTIGNVTNPVCHAHQNAVLPINFLTIPKCKSYVHCQCRARTNEFFF